MGTNLSYLIIGNGITGITAAEILRAEEPLSSITIVADDPFPVYYRPALKDYLAGSLNEEKLWARPSTFYQEQQIRFVPGRVIGINATQNFVQLHNGQRIGYHKLLLANGARPRQLSCPGLNLAGVTTLRTIVDYKEILHRLDRAKRIVICGSGTLALESAETLNHRGYQVTHLLRQHTLWSEVLDPIASDLVLQEEQRDGIDIRTGEEITEIIGRKGQVSEVITTSGARIPCDLVLIAIGIEPSIDFIQAGNITCGRGVKVDYSMRTNVPHIYAAGDVIEITDNLTGRTRVPGQWYPAIAQARTAAYGILGQFDDRRSMPITDNNYYNATFLYGLDFVSIGLTTIPPAVPGFQEIVADPQPRKYRKLILHNGIPLGILFLGDRNNALAFKRSIDHKVNLTSVSNRLFTDGFNLDEWLDYHSIPPVVLDIVRVGHDESVWIKQSQSERAQVSPLLHQVKETQSSLGQTVESMRAYLVPVPHPRVNVTLQETALDLSKQGNVVTIGRQNGSSLEIEHSSVSRLHCEIMFLNGNFLLREKGSSNGTFVNNAPLAPDSMCTLRNLDHVRFGDVQFRFELRQQPVIPSPSSGDKMWAYSSSFSATDTPKNLAVGMIHRSDAQLLTEERVRFEINMCIGCDRCMSVCPIPMSTSVNIADLNYATITDNVAEHVTHFTHECIMCGSCVPVPPVDNHRDLLMLSLKQRLGVSWNNKAQLFPPLKRVYFVGWET